MSRPEPPDTTTGQDTAVSTPARLRLAIGRLNRRMRLESSTDLTPLQTAVLVALEEHAPLRLTELARREAVTPPTMSRAIATLDEAGLLERRSDPTDARSALIELSDPGRAAIAQARTARTATLTSRLDRLTADQRAALARALPALEALADVENE